MTGTDSGIRSLAAVVLAVLGCAVAALPAWGQEEAVSIVRSVSASSGWLGVSIKVTEETGSTDGELLVVDVWSGGPAEAAGLRPGDAIVAVNRAPVSVGGFHSLIRRLQPGDPISLTVIRDGNEVELSLVAAQRPAPETRLQRELDSVRSRLVRILNSTVDDAELADSLARAVRFQAPTIEVERVGSDSITTRVILREERGDGTAQLHIVSTGGTAPRAPLAEVAMIRARAAAEAATREPSDVRGEPEVRPLAPYLAGMNRVAGAELKSLNPSLGRYFGVDEGLLVTQVAEGTPAAAAGLRGGDVIVAAAGAPVATLAALRTRLSDLDGAELTVLRDGRERTLRLR